MLTREEAVDASRARARVARGTDMTFWKGLLKQIAKCSLLTDGEKKKKTSPLSPKEEERDGESSSGILYAFVSQLGNLHRRREKKEFWRKRRPRMKYRRSP